MRGNGTNSGHSSDPSSMMTMDLNPTFASQMNIGIQLLPEGVKGFIALGKLFVEYFLSMYSLPLEVYLRWRWGVRAFTLLQMIFLWCLVPVGFFIGGPLTGLFLLGAASLGSWHFWESRRYEANHPRASWRLTYSFGEPEVWIRIARYAIRRGVSHRFISDSLVLRLLEPATGLVLGIAVVFLPLTAVLGIILLVSGAALLVKRHLIHMRFIDETRDRLDAVAIGSIMSELSEAERAPMDEGKAFEVRLAVSPGTFAASHPPLPLPPAKVVAAMIVDVDASGRPKVECPSCSSRIRCHAGCEGKTMKCPKCEHHFVVEAVGESAF